MTGACTSGGVATCAKGTSSATITCNPSIETADDCYWETQQNFTGESASCPAGYVAVARGASGNQRDVQLRNIWYATAIKCCKAKNDLYIQPTSDVPDSRCSLCLDGFTLLNVSASNGTVQELCLPEFCPKGQRMVTNFNGITYCLPCTIQNCADCQNVTAKFNVTPATDPVTHKEEVIEVCGSCFPPFVLDAFKTSCISFAEWAS